MKSKLLLSLFALCLFHFVSHAQSVKLMPMAGINYSMMAEDFDDYNFDGRTGWQAGLEVKVGQRFYVSPGIYFFDSKAKIKEINDINIEPLNLEIDYESIMFPLMIGGDLFASDNLGLRAEAGPSFSIFLDESDDMKASNILLKDNAWGLQFGVAADIGFLTIGLRQQIGLTNVFNFEDAADAKLHLFQLNVGLRL